MTATRKCAACGVRLPVAMFPSDPTSLRPGGTVCEACLPPPEETGQDLTERLGGSPVPLEEVEPLEYVSEDSRASVIDLRATVEQEFPEILPRLAVHFRICEIMAERADRGVIIQADIGKWETAAKKIVDLLEARRNEQRVASAEEEIVALLSTPAAMGVVDGEPCPSCGRVYASEA